MLGLKKETSFKISSKQIQKIFSRYFKIFVILAVIIFLAASYMFIIKPKYNSILAKNRKDIAEKSQQRDNLSAVYNQIKAYKESYGKIKESDKNKINNFLIDSENKENLFTYIEYLINSQGLILKSIEIKSDSKAAKAKAKSVPAAAAQKLGEQEVGVEIIGADYASLKNLLSKFEKSLLIIDVTDMDADFEGRSASLTLKFYYLK